VRERLQTDPPVAQVYVHPQTQVRHLENVSHYMWSSICLTVQCKCSERVRCEQSRHPDIVIGLAKLF
jgi:hypothetical protein